MNIIVDGSGNVHQWSETAAPTPEAGQTLVALDDAQAAALRTATASPNGGLTFINGTVGAKPVVPA